MNRLLSWAVAALVVAGAVAGPAQAVQIRVSRNDIAVTQEQCIAKGRQAMEAAGLRLLDNSRNAAWGEMPALEILVTVYCMTDKQTFLVVAASPDSVSTPSLERLLDTIDQAMTR